MQDELSSGLPQLVESPGEQACEPDATIEGYPGLTAFDDWFSDGDGRETYERELVLYPDHDGSYVNRSGEGGEQWVGYEGEEWAEDGYFTCSWCLDGDCNDPCSGETTLYDGNPLFFPLDDISSVAHPATLTKAAARITVCSW